MKKRQHKIGFVVAGVSLAISPLLASAALSKDVTPSSLSLGHSDSSKGKPSLGKPFGLTEAQLKKLLHDTGQGHSKGCSPS